MEHSERIVDYLNRYSIFSESYYGHSKSSSIVMKNGSISQVGNSSNSGYSFRVLNNSFAFGATNSNDWNSIKNTLNSTIDRSMIPGRNRFSREEINKDEWKVKQKKKVEDTDPSEKISILKEIDRILSDNQIPMRIIAIGDSSLEQYLINSEGTQISSKQHKVSFFAMIGYQENGQFEQRFIQLGYSGGYEAIEFWDLYRTVEEEASALKKAVLAKGTNPGKYDLVVGPEISGIVAHESGGHPMELDRILGREMAQAGESFIKLEDVGRTIGSENVNVVDDPTIPGSYGYYLYDRDGVKARKRYLYKKGLVNDFLSNRESAGRIDSKSTGASRASDWDMDPLPRMSTTYIEPGDYQFEELIEDIKEGIYLKSYTEWNIDDIRFNEKYVGLEAYIIRDGKLGEQIRRPTLETTTVKFYSSIDAVGKDLRFYAGTCGKGDPMQGVDVWMGGPHLRLRNLVIR